MVELEPRLITIARSFDKTTQTQRIRRVPILDPLHPVLREWRLRCPPTSGNWVFPSPTPSARCTHQARGSSNRSTIEQGFDVLPLQGIQDSCCTCGRRDCSSPEKHPLAELAPNGVKSATGDPKLMRELFYWRPEINIGIATGPDCVVLDIDPRHGGERSLQELEAKHGRLPATVTATTGSGGKHIYFRRPEAPLRNRVAMAPGLDLRTDGGYVVAPPSRHAAGGTYRWDRDDGLVSTDLAATAAKVGKHGK